MPRNAEVTRQWTILRELDASSLGRTLQQLADMCGVHQRTIRRDLEALQAAGFPVRDVDGEPPRRWTLDRRPFKHLDDTGFSLAEACALYFSRTLLEELAGGPFRSDLATAFAKIERVLTPKMRKFLDRIPQVVVAKPAPRPAVTRDRTSERLVAELLDAILRTRVVAMRYHSQASQRTKDYVVHPSQVVYGMGALYLLAYVPEYDQVRTFALERIEKLSVGEDVFTPVKELTSEVFPHSLGIHSGPPVKVSLEFLPEIAGYIRDRRWHPSQRLDELADGRVRLALDVCDDYALRAWILGFGRAVRVLGPPALAERIVAELEDARDRYKPRLDLDLPLARFDPEGQRILPFNRRIS